MGGGGGWGGVGGGGLMLTQQDAHAVAYYIAQYACKPQVHMDHAATVMTAAIGRLHRELSENAELVESSPQNIARRFALRCLSAHGACSERTGPEVCALLMALPESLQSHSFVPLFYTNMLYQLEAAAGEAQGPVEHEQFNLRRDGDRIVPSNARMDYTCRDYALRHLCLYGHMMAFRKVGLTGGTFVLYPPFVSDFRVK